jgi:hypothetical protein
MNHADNIKRLVNIFSFSLTSYYSGNGSNEAIRETKEKLYAAIDAQATEIDRLREALKYAHNNGAPWGLQTYIRKALEQTK